MTHSRNDDVSRYRRPYAERDLGPRPTHHEDQDHRPTREEILRLDWRIHLGFPLHLPTDVDQQTRIRRIWPIHCSPKMLLSELFVLSTFLSSSVFVFCNVSYSFCFNFSVIFVNSSFCETNEHVLDVDVLILPATECSIVYCPRNRSNSSNLWVNQGGK